MECIWAWWVSCASPLVGSLLQSGRACPGRRVSLSHPKGGRQRVGCDGARWGRRGACHRSGRAEQSGAGARRRRCRREAGPREARQARKAVLGAVPVWPAAGVGPG